MAAKKRATKRTAKKSTRKRTTKRKATKRPAKRRAAKRTTKRTGKKGSHHATIPRIPAGHIAFVQGNEVRTVKRKSRRAKRK